MNHSRKGFVRTDSVNAVSYGAGRVYRSGLGIRPRREVLPQPQTQHDNAIRP